MERDLDGSGDVCSVSASRINLKSADWVLGAWQGDAPRISACFLLCFLSSSDCHSFLDFSFFCIVPFRSMAAFILVLRERKCAE